MDSQVLRLINRKVAAKYLPELAPLFDDLTRQGFEPRLVSLKFTGQALDYFNLLVREHQSHAPSGARADALPV